MAFNFFCGFSMNFRIYIYREKIDYPNETEGNNDSSNEMNYKLNRVKIL